MGQGISAHEILADIPAWEAMLARHAETFAPLLPGCSLALVPKADTERRPGRMLVWERSGGDGMKAEVRPFTGYKGCGVDILFAAEVVGAVRGIDPETGQYYDDTKRYIDAVDWVSAADKKKIFEGNVSKVYPRAAARLARARP